MAFIKTGEVKAAAGKETETKFKPLWLFVIAANSLLLSGAFMTVPFDWKQILVMQWCGFCGVFIIYRFNDLIDQSHDLRFNLRRLLSNKLHLFFLLQFIFLTIPAVFIFLSPFRILLLSFICIAGIIYSVNFSNGTKQFRIKNIFIVKNLYIGILWGILVLAGAASTENQLVIPLTVFAIIQVTIGSIIRDIPDLERDRSAHVNSFPVVFGIKRTILNLIMLNAFSLAPVFICNSKLLLIILLPVFVWRMINLVCILPSGISRWWTQTLNLLTCLLILIIIFMLYYVLA